jgi:hypothetical protein
MEKCCVVTQDTLVGDTFKTCAWKDQGRIMCPVRLHNIREFPNIDKWYMWNLCMLRSETTDVPCVTTQHLWTHLNTISDIESKLSEVKSLAFPAHWAISLYIYVSFSLHVSITLSTYLYIYLPSQSLSLSLYVSITFSTYQYIYLPSKSLSFSLSICPPLSIAQSFCMCV